MTAKRKIKNKREFIIEPDFTKIKKIRLRKKLLQIEFADKLGISQPAVVKLEKEGIRRIDTAKKYGEILNIKPINLLEI